MHLALMRAAVLEQPLELGTIGRLGALALLFEPFEDFPPLALAVLLARTELCRQTQVLDLLLRDDVVTAVQQYGAIPEFEAAQ
jgi:hypothetical protein